MRVSSDLRSSQGWRGARALLLAGLLTSALGGCIESLDDPGASAISTTTPQTDANPGNATLAFSSIDGMPAGFGQHFMQLALAQAKARDIALVDPSTADYLARGYLSAYQDESGPKLAFVWDIFDRQKHRAQRIEDSIPLGNSDADPWTLVNDQALTAAATAGAEDIAEFLATTPQATAPTPAPKPGARPAAAPAVAALDRLAAVPAEPSVAGNNGALAYSEAR
jgi:hypothetical protein